MQEALGRWGSRGSQRGSQRGPCSWGKGFLGVKGLTVSGGGPWSALFLQEWGELGQESVMATRLIPVRNEVPNCTSLLSWTPTGLRKRLLGFQLSFSSLFWRRSRCWPVRSGTETVREERGRQA